MFNLGQVLIIFTSVTTLIAMVAYLPGVRKGPGKPLLSVARPAVYATCLGLMASVGTLWYLIATHQYQYDYVFRYTSNDMPQRYIISAFWGGQEGTFLLWALYGGLLAVFLRFKAKQFEAPVQFFYLGINLFLMFMLIKASPFNKLPGVPVDGNGLNPLLQDPWMTIHPPVMFFGFASLGIPAAYAMAAMVKEDWDNWVHRAIPWTSFGILALGTGLVMGGYWAYSILGWGGFWGWDPVENSSLVPWLVAITLLHNQVIQMKRGLFRRLNLFTAMLPFLLLTYSTFLTRSGVLADFSVHSFTDLGINQFLAAFMIVFLVGGLGLFAWKFRRIPVERTQTPFFTREYFMFLGALSIGLFALFVLLGTSAPVLTRMWGPPSNVQPEFYNRMGVPFAILIGVLISIAPFLIWKQAMPGKAMRKMLMPFGLTLATIPALVFAGVREPGYLFMTVGGFFALFSNTWVVLVIMRRKLSASGGYLAHVGIGLAILGILASTAYSEKTTVVLPQDEEVLVMGYGFTYMGTREVEGGRKNAYDIALRTREGSYIVSPTMYFSDFNAGMMKKPDIKEFWNRDVYIAPVAHAADPLEERIQTKVVLAKDQPMAGFGMELTFTGFKTVRHEANDGHNHDHQMDDVIAEIQVTIDGKRSTIEPVLRTLEDGHTEVMPVALGETGFEASLLAVDTAGNHAQIGVTRPPIALMRGESGSLEGASVHFTNFDVVMGTRRGGSVKVFAEAHVEVDGEVFDVKPGLISRPETEELEFIEAPLGRTGYNLVLAKIDAAQGRAYFHLAPTPREYFYAEISLKPFIVLLWIGTVVTVLGLLIATLNRGRLASRLAAAVAREEAAEAKKNGKREAA